MVCVATFTITSGKSLLRWYDGLLATIRIPHSRANSDISKLWRLAWSHLITSWKVHERAIDQPRWCFASFIPSSASWASLSSSNILSDTLGSPASETKSSYSHVLSSWFSMDPFSGDDTKLRDGEFWPLERSSELSHPSSRHKCVVCNLVLSRHDFIPKERTSVVRDEVLG